MDDRMLFLVVGAAVGIAGTLFTVGLMHFLEIQKVKAQKQTYQSQHLHDKQFEFVERISPILTEMSVILTAVKQMFSMPGNTWVSQYPQEWAEIRKRNAQVNNLLRQYIPFLTREVILTASLLYQRAAGPMSRGEAQEAYNTIVTLQNMMRKLVGGEALTRELLDNFAQKQEKGETFSRRLLELFGERQ